MQISPGRVLAMRVRSSVNGDADEPSDFGGAAGASGGDAYKPSGVDDAYS